MTRSDFLGAENILPVRPYVTMVLKNACGSQTTTDVGTREKITISSSTAALLFEKDFKRNIGQWRVGFHVVWPSSPPLAHQMPK